jgi:hypothetical protein
MPDKRMGDLAESELDQPRVRRATHRQLSEHF